MNVCVTVAMVMMLKDVECYGMIFIHPSITFYEHVLLCNAIKYMFTCYHFVVFVIR
jgi:hypothetical protein